jgi:hypothetical protein
MVRAAEAHGVRLVRVGPSGAAARTPQASTDAGGQPRREEPDYAPMEGGFLAERNYRAKYPVIWASGAIEWSLFNWVKMRGRRQIYVTTYRCTDCGFLEAYAPQI